MRHLHVLAFAVLATLVSFGGSPLAVGPSLAHAQDTSSVAAPAERRRSTRSRARTRAPRVVVSFPGFGMNPDGTSRCFVHVAGTITPETHASGRRFEVRLPGASVSARNHLNPLETRYFNTPMLRARLVRRGRTDLVLVVELRADVSVTMRTEADPNGGTRVVVDLPAGTFVTAPPRIGQSWEDDSSENAQGGRDLRDGTGSVRPSTRSDEAPDEGSEGRDAQRAAEPPPARSSGTDTERPPVFGN